jgi:hypothetical protein
MALYTLYNLLLEVQHEAPATGAAVDVLLQTLSCVRIHALRQTPSLRLLVRRRDQAVCLPPAARAVFQAEGFCGLEQEEEFYLTDGASLLHLRAREGQGEAQLAPAFFHKPGRLQSTFWVFGLCKLLRPVGLYSLHAAGVVTPAGLGVLIVGPSGSGKSTLTIGLVRQGWRYLSDDAVLIRQQPEGVAALAFRRHVYVDACAAARYADLPLGETVPDTAGRQRQRVRLEEVYPGHQVLTCLPGVLLFARIVPQAHSTVRPLESRSALQALLANSGPQLFDRETMPQHLEVLKHLVQQATPYELQAGHDLYQQPDLLGHLLHNAEGGMAWRA